MRTSMKNLVLHCPSRLAVITPAISRQQHTSPYLQHPSPITHRAAPLIIPLPPPPSRDRWSRLETRAAFKGLRPDYRLVQTITTHRSPVCGVYGAARAPCSCARAAAVPDGTTKARQPAVVSAGRMGGWLIGDGQRF